MKFTVAAAATMVFAGLASAQIPSCAQPCLTSAISSATKCSASDLACQCEPANQQAITTAATSCVLSACGQTEALQVLSAAQAECAAATAGGAGGASTAAATSSAAKTSAAATSSSAAAATTSASSAASSTLATQPASSSAASTSAASTPSSASNGTAPSTTPFKGGAAQMGVSLGGVIVLAMAALVAF